MSTPRRSAAGYPGRHPDPDGHPIPAPSSNSAGVTAFVLALLALLVGPIGYTFTGYPEVSRAPIIVAGLAVVLVIVAAPLAFLGYARVKRGQADARGLNVTALVLCGAVPLLLIAQLVGSFVSYDTSATDLCDALQGQYDQSLRTGTMYEASGTAAAVEDASPGVGWPAQIDRATQMTRDRCPDRTLAVSFLQRRMVSGIGY